MIDRTVATIEATPAVMVVAYSNFWPVPLIMMYCTAVARADGGNLSEGC